MTIERQVGVGALITIILERRTGHDPQQSSYWTVNVSARTPKGSTHTVTHTVHDDEDEAFKSYMRTKSVWGVDD